MFGVEYWHVRNDCMMHDARWEEGDRVNLARFHLEKLHRRGRGEGSAAVVDDGES